MAAAGVKRHAGSSLVDEAAMINGAKADAGYRIVDTRSACAASSPTLTVARQLCIGLPNVAFARVPQVLVLYIQDRNLGTSIFWY
jgi:hypothetical protein